MAFMDVAIVFLFIPTFLGWRGGDSFSLQMDICEELGSSQGIGDKQGDVFAHPAQSNASTVSIDMDSHGEDVSVNDDTFPTFHLVLPKAKRGCVPCGGKKDLPVTVTLNQQTKRLIIQPDKGQESSLSLYDITSMGIREVEDSAVFTIHTGSTFSVAFGDGASTVNELSALIGEIREEIERQRLEEMERQRRERETRNFMAGIPGYITSKVKETLDSFFKGQDLARYDTINFFDWDETLFASDAWIEEAHARESPKGNATAPRPSCSEEEFLKRLDDAADALIEMQQGISVIVTNGKESTWVAPLIARMPRLKERVFTQKSLVLISTRTFADPIPRFPYQLKYNKINVFPLVVGAFAREGSERRLRFHKLRSYGDNPLDMKAGRHLAENSIWLCPGLQWFGVKFIYPAASLDVVVEQLNFLVREGLQDRHVWIDIREASIGAEKAKEHLIRDLRPVSEDEICSGWERSFRDHALRLPLLTV